ncbi:hypothetical protein MOF34_15865 [Bacillus sp. T17B1]|uniref:hypothetical protein n=1 Tax=Bacillus sp. T17B1 TaxID=2918911 RepID=UPI002280FA2F|nr:hypothetical protein [Bacillus sp. T17B1]
MKEINMIERFYCGSGGCMSCPFSHSDEAEMAQNYGCLPTPKQIFEDEKFDKVQQLFRKLDDQLKKICL